MPTGADGSPDNIREEVRINAFAASENGGRQAIYFVSDGS